VTHLHPTHPLSHRLRFTVGFEAHRHIAHGPVRLNAVFSACGWLLIGGNASKLSLCPLVLCEMSKVRRTVDAYENTPDFKWLLGSFLREQEFSLFGY